MDEPILDAGLSASRDNAYYVPGCRHAEHRPPYAACLTRIEERKQGRLESRPECSAAIGRKDCPAQAMRQQELDAGRPIYFVSRKALNEQMRITAEENGQRIAEMVAQGRDWAPTGRRKKALAAAKAAAAAPTTPPSYADAINAALAKAAATAAATAAAMSPVPPAAAEIRIQEAPGQPTASSAALESSVTADLQQPKTTGLSMLDLARLARQRQTAAAAA